MVQRTGDATRPEDLNSTGEATREQEDESTGLDKGGDCNSEENEAGQHKIKAVPFSRQDVNQSLHGHRRRQQGGKEPETRHDSYRCFVIHKRKIIIMYSFSFVWRRRTVFLSLQLCLKAVAFPALALSMVRSFHPLS